MNRGLDVLVILFCGLLLMSACGGVYYNFGTFYLLILEKDLIDAPKLALVGTSADITFCLVMPYTVTYLQRNHGIVLGMLVGGALLTGGLIISSFIEEIRIWFLTYSFVIGLGEALIFMAVIEMVYTRSPTSLRSFMMGFASGGMFIGLSIFAPITLELAEWTGIWVTLRILAAIFGGAIIIAAITWTFYEPYLTAMASKRPTSISLSEFTGAKQRTDSIFFWATDLHFQLMFTSILLLALGYIVPFVHLLKAAEIDGVTNYDYIPISMGFTGFAGRLLFGAIADIISKKYPQTAPNLNLFTFCVISCGILLCLLPLCNSLWSYAVVGGIYAFVGGGRAGLLSLMCGEVFGESNATVVYGFLCWAFIPQLVGPSAVAYLQEQTGDYTPGFLSVGIITLIAALPMLYICAITQHFLNRNDSNYIKLAEAPE